MKKAKGFIVYEGKSQLDTNVDIVAILTMKTTNAKTGNMAQLWILHKDIEPHTATKTGDDYAVCGSCPQRHYNGGACYVTTFQAPLAVYRTYKKGGYAKGLPAFNYHASVRLGAYGDPAALPYETIVDVCSAFGSHTGYTHQASHRNFDNRLQGLVMASADTYKQAIKLQAKGFKTFRVKLPNDGYLDNEIECLADSKGLTCEQCGICDGDQKNVAISVHGSKKSKFKSSIIPTVSV